MLLDLIDLGKLRRAMVYALLLAGIFFVQNLLLSRLPLLGVRAMIVPAAVAAVGLFEGGEWGGLMGLAAGYFYDMGTTHVVLFTVLLTGVGFFAGVLGQFWLRRGFVSFLTLALIALALAAFGQMFRFLFLADAETRTFQQLYLGRTGIWRVLRTGAIQVVWSLFWSVPLYFPCKVIASRPMSR